jgi:Sec-independent protein translocase protein TatA
MGFTIVILVVIAVLIYYYVSRMPRKGGKAGALRKELQTRLNQPPGEAEETIERHIKNLRARHPGRSEEWYLEKILYDLERDR